jgi:hypothetical protein
MGDRGTVFQFPARARVFLRLQDFTAIPIFIGFGVLTRRTDEVGWRRFGVTKHGLPTSSTLCVKAQKPINIVWIFLFSIAFRSFLGSTRTLFQRSSLYVGGTTGAWRWQLNSIWYSSLTVSWFISTTPYYFIALCISQRRDSFTQSWSQRSWTGWPSGLRRGFAADRLLGLRVRTLSIPVAEQSKARVCCRSLTGVVGSNPANIKILQSWMSVSCECCVLSGRGLCAEPIALPEELYRRWCFVFLVIQKAQEWGDSGPRWAVLSQREKGKDNDIFATYEFWTFKVSGLNASLIE